MSTHEEFKAAVSAAKEAFPSWRNTPITTRQRVMLKLQELIRRDMVSILGHSMAVTFIPKQRNIHTGTHVIIASPLCNCFRINLL